MWYRFERSDIYWPEVWRRFNESPDGWIRPPRILWSVPLPDYSERLARESGSREAVVAAKYQGD